MPDPSPEFHAIVNESSFVPREQTQLAALSDGSLVLIAGLAGNGSVLSDVHRSLDGGARWNEVMPAAPFAPRAGHAVVVFADDSIVLLGGQDGDKYFNDVWLATSRGSQWREQTHEAAWWPRALHRAAVAPDGDIVLSCGSALGSAVNDVWRSSDRGKTWRLVSVVPNAFSPRMSHGMIVGNDGSITVFSGRDGTAQIKDGWRSTDGGRTFEQVVQYSVTASAFASVSDGGTTFVMAGFTSGTLSNPVRASVDGGKTWWRVPLQEFPMRSHAAAAILPDGTVVVVGGNNGTHAMGDVWAWRRSVPLRWRELPCDSRLPGICASRVHAGVVSVALPGGAGRVQPANTALWSPAVAAYVPPVPVITVAEESAATAASTISFQVSFSSKVQHLRADHFVVEPCGAVAVSSLLTGSGQFWSLDVVVDGATVDGGACPDGFIASPGSDLCARPSNQLMSWHGHHAACAPYDLAVASSVSELEFIATVRPWAAGDYWYVATVAVRALQCSHHLTFANCWLTRIGLVSSGDDGSLWEFVGANRSTVTGFVPWGEGEPRVSGAACGFLRTSGFKVGEQWELLDSSPLGTHAGHQLVPLPDGSVLLFGGSSTGNGTAPRTDTWQTTTGTDWSLVSGAGVPAMLAPAASVALQSSAVIYAGSHDVNGDINSTVWRLDEATVGTPWRRVASNVPWRARREHAMVALPSGSLVLFGGRDATVGSTWLNDVWTSHDEGVSWVKTASTANWSPRTTVSGCSLQDGAILVIGGLGADGFLRDVWRSDNGGASFFELPTPLWSAASNNPTTVYKGIVFVVGMVTDESLLSTIYKSEDGGFSWSAVVQSAPWSSRLSHAVASLGDGSLLVVGGKDSSEYFDDVWVSHRQPGAVVVQSDLCGAVKRSICTARKGEVAVSVSLPRIVGSVVPAPVASTVAAALYKPPVPTIFVRDAGVAPGEVKFDVTWSHPVAGLHWRDFDVAVSGGSVGVLILNGRLTSWTLTVTVLPGTVRRGQCPPGYQLSPDATLCGRAVEELRSWPAHKASCAPYSLAHVPSAADLSFLATLPAWKFEAYWCVVCLQWWARR